MLWKFILVMTMIAASTASYNAREAHMHAHELACVLKHESLCEYATKD